MKKRVLFGALLTVALAAAAGLPVQASSHREAPGITKMPKVDGTDMYMFRSFETGRQGYVTLIADYQPFQDPFGGPNYFTLDPNALYRIHIDNTGDGVEDITFQFRVAQLLRDLKVPVGGKQISVPLTNIGPISESPQHRSPLVNVLESYTLAVVRGPMSHPTSIQYAGNTGFNTKRFDKPVDNIGQKSIPDYPSYAAGFIWDFDFPGCAGNAQGRVFVGQRKEPFAVNVGEIFDLVNVANPLGPRDAQPNALQDKNITTFALEVPIACLTNGSNPIIGGWQTAALPRNQALTLNPTFKNPTNQSGAFVQVSRLGMPLVNEIVIGLKDKDKFNASQPKDDAQFLDYVTNPSLPALLEILFGSAGVRAPTNFPRTDLIAAFLTGIQGVNKFGVPSEMERLNTSIAPTAAGAQNNLGVLGGDNAGFPNGRRPGDDVTDIELRVAMGVLCHAVPAAVGCTAADAPSGALPFTDQTIQDQSQFDAVFPYLKNPLPGSPNGPNGVDVP
jgi:hypothetical protein